MPLPAQELRARPVICAAAALFCLAPLALVPRSSPAPETPAGGVQREGLGPELEVGSLLVASRDLADPNFAETVIVLVDYNADGALGLVVNRLSAAPLARVLPGIEGLGDRPLYLGGPVDTNRLMILLRSDHEPEGSDRHVAGDLYLGSSVSLLKQLLAIPEGAEPFHVYAGYAGWGPEQLDFEVATGSWLVLPFDADLIFNEGDGGLWQRLIQRTSTQWAWQPRLRPAIS